MSLRPILIHACFDQSAGNPRPARCKCRYRVSKEQAEEYVKDGRASHIIVNWKKDSAGNSIPVEGPNLVWGSEPEETDTEEKEGWERRRSSLALKTPRTPTIDDEHIYRAYIEKKVWAQERINEWGRLAQEVISDLTVEYAPDFIDPFEGKPVFYFIGYEPRTKGGYTAQKNKNKT